MHVGTAAPGGGYVDQLAVPSSGEAEPTGGELAVAPNGAAVVIWAELVGSNLEISSTGQPSGQLADSAPPTVTLKLPSCSKKLSKKTCKRRQALRSAWHTLAGQVTDPSPSSGIASVQVAIYLTSGKRIEGLVGGHFRKITKTKARKTFASAKLNGSTWSLKLPKLRAGRYTILVRGTDRIGHVSATISKTVQLT